MEYPFKFKSLLLTDGVLDALGFSEYWAGCGDFGTRSLSLGNPENKWYMIYDIDETEDDTGGYGTGAPEYCEKHFCTEDFNSIYFLHEMYEDIVSRRSEDEILSFVEILKKKGVNMYPHLQSYLEYKNTAL